MKKTFKFILPKVAYFEDEKHPFLPRLSDATRNLYEDPGVYGWPWYHKDIKRRYK